MTFLGFQDPLGTRDPPQYSPQGTMSYSSFRCALGKQPQRPMACRVESCRYPPESCPWWACVCMHVYALSEAVNQASPVPVRELSSPWLDGLLTRGSDWGFPERERASTEVSAASLLLSCGLSPGPPHCRWQRLTAAWLISIPVLTEQGHSGSELPWKHLHQNSQHPPQVASSSSDHSAF